MIEITILNKEVNEILDIVQELRCHGLIQNTDFDFAYSSEQRDYYGNIERQKHTIFKFYNESLATWFALRYT